MRAKRVAPIGQLPQLARSVLPLLGMQAATRLATAFDGPATRAIAIVFAAFVAGVAHHGAARELSRTLGPKPDRVLAADRTRRADVRLPACERYWLDASVHRELWLWPNLAIGPLLAVTAIDRTAWMEALCEGYRTRSWTP